jgi:hypothetical protein
VDADIGTVKERFREENGPSHNITTPHFQIVMFLPAPALAPADERWVFERALYITPAAVA